MFGKVTHTIASCIFSVLMMTITFNAVLYTTPKTRALFPAPRRLDPVSVLFASLISGLHYPARLASLVVSCFGRKVQIDFPPCVGDDLLFQSLIIERRVIFDDVAILLHHIAEVAHIYDLPKAHSKRLEIFPSV